MTRMRSDVGAIRSPAAFGGAGAVTGAAAQCRLADANHQRIEVQVIVNVFCQRVFIRSFPPHAACRQRSRRDACLIEQPANHLVRIEVLRRERARRPLVTPRIALDRVHAADGVVERAKRDQAVADREGST